MTGLSATRPMVWRAWRPHTSLYIDVAIYSDLKQMPFAAITCGNHELYINSTIENMAQVQPCVRC